MPKLPEPAAGAVGGPSWNRPLTPATTSAATVAPNAAKDCVSASPRASSMSSSTMVPVAWSSVNSALTSSARATVNVSSCSASGSLDTFTSIAIWVVPGAKVRVPLAAV